MKKLLSALVMLALVTSMTSATVPDPDYCEVNPADDMNCPRIIGVPQDADGGSAFADLEIIVRGGPSLPLAGKDVEVWVNPDCTDLFFCDALVLTGVTAADGSLDLNMQMGGCCNLVSAAIVIADGVPIRAYEWIASPDNNGGVGDGVVGLPDFVTFGGTWGPGCTDLDGSCDAGIPDFVAFGASWGQECEPQP